MIGVGYYFSEQCFYTVPFPIAPTNRGFELNTLVER